VIASFVIAVFPGVGFCLELGALRLQRCGRIDAFGWILRQKNEGLGVLRPPRQ
jgi:hypothetical protein